MTLDRSSVRNNQVKPLSLLVLILFQNFTKNGNQNGISNTYFTHIVLVTQKDVILNWIPVFLEAL